MVCENLYLVGDIIDFWELDSKRVWLESDTEVIRQMILKKQNNKTNIYYVIGNHDGILRKHLNDISLAGIYFCNEMTHIGVNGSSYLVVHGDLFDNAAPVWNIVSKMGGRAYSFSLLLNKWVNGARHLVGKEPWSFSVFLYENVKSAVGSNHYIKQFEKHMVEYCKGRYDGAICGHVHRAVIKDTHGLIYMNCGDFVESCTALVEHANGSFEIIYC
jgi:UDP-2,3-diacylglucosamine pyrophosphatase LpxH